MKKICVMLMVLSLALCVALLPGCDSNRSKQLAESPAPAQEQAPAQEAAPSQETPPSVPETEVIELKAGHSQAPDHPFNGTVEYFAKLVNEKTNGAVKITVFPNSQLGDEATMLDSLSMGTLDILMANASNTASRVPELGLVNVCFMFNDRQHLERVVADEEIFNRYSAIVKEKNQGFTLLNVMGNGARHLYANKAIGAIEDMQGLKVRVMPSELDNRVWTALGTAPGSTPFSEVYTALQTGMMDAAENTVSSYTASKHYEVAPHLVMTDHQWLITQLWASDATLAKLPAEYVDAIMQAAKETVPYAIELQVNTDADFLKQLVDAGSITVHEIDRTPLMEKIQPLQDEVAKELGVEDILAKIRSLA
ncbi:MAG: TRAP transporter substrate-binding protein [Eubacterium sp.]|nr:TRAP transporter substrate-binding protein [Eubacterium sp.]